MHTDLSLCRLFQLISPSLPIGSYTYSQGIEWAVECGWIESEEDLFHWLKGQLDTSMTYLELPVFLRLFDSWSRQDEHSVDHWNQYLLSSRESLELRQEEVNRARAFTQVILSLDESAGDVKSQLIQTQHACLSYACVKWNIDSHQACLGLLWSWMENLVLAAVKIIPLGQTAGQRLIFRLSEYLDEVITRARHIEDDNLGYSSMALGIASSQHETQYTRLFRS